MVRTLITNEAIEYCCSCKCEVLFKPDFGKAYDHVVWGFLDKVLAKKVLCTNGGLGSGVGLGW